MIAVFRFIYIATFVGSVWLAFTEGFWTGLGAFLTVGVLLWVALTLVGAFQALRNALSRPNQHLHLYVEPHSDPTRPDWDEHPLIIIDQDRRNNGR
jgi:hypothetical protein